jgi:hypothetical protein
MDDTIVHNSFPVLWMWLKNTEDLEEITQKEMEKHAK